MTTPIEIDMKSCH